MLDILTKDVFLMVSVQEYANLHNVSLQTVYRWIREGKIQTEKHDGKIHILSEDVKQFNIRNDETNSIELLLNQQNQQINRLEKENEYLRQELSQANQTIADAQQRHDEAQQQSNMIVMQLTKQNQLLLEDQRNHSLWRRFKAALRFAS